MALIVSYLSNRQQRVVLNEKLLFGLSSRISAGTTFLVYINDLVDDISSDAKLFADDTSLFTIVYDEITSANQLDRNLKLISEWTY